MRIYVDDQLIVDQWTSLRHWDTGLTEELVAGKSHDFKVEYVEDIDWAEVTIGWRVVKDN